MKPSFSRISIESHAGAVRASSPPGLSVAGSAATVALVAAALVALVVGFRSTWGGLVEVWGRSESYMHGYLIAPIVAWLCWRMRGPLSRAPRRFASAGLVALVGAAATWAAAEAASVDLVAFAAVVAMVPATIVMLIGIPAASAIAFPLAFLAFMVPVGEQVVPLLVDWTANATVFALRLSGLPVYRDGIYFSLPTGNWEIEDGCSGLRYVIATLVLSTLFAYLNFRSVRRRVVFVAVAFGLSIVANWVRAYVIVLIGHFSAMRYGVGDDHLFYGWVMFGVLIFGIFWAGQRWGDAVPGRADVPAPDPVAGGEPMRAGSLGATLAGLALAASVVAGAKLFVAAIPSPAPLAGVDERVRSAFGPIAERPLSIGSSFKGATSVVGGTLPGGVGDEMLVAYYAGARRGAELVNVENVVIDREGGRWRVDAAAERPVGEGPGPGSVTETLVRSADGRKIVWTWYAVNGAATASPLRAQWRVVGTRLRLEPLDATVAVLVADATDDLDPVRARLGHVAARLHEVLVRATTR